MKAIATAKTWDHVKIHYTGYRPDLTVFDSTTAREPLLIQIGDELLIPGLEQALVGMAPGEIKKVTIQPNDAYGDFDSDLIFEVNREEVFGKLEVKPGQVIELPNDEVGVLVLKVLEVKDKTVLLDGNHELAGQALTFDLELIEIV
jgi:peptidylprolyl isomerase